VFTPVSYLLIYFVENWLHFIAVQDANRYMSLHYRKGKHFANSERREKKKNWRRNEVILIRALETFSFFFSFHILRSKHRAILWFTFLQTKERGTIFFCFKFLNRFHFTPYLGSLCQQYPRPSSWGKIEHYYFLS